MSRDSKRAIVNAAITLFNVNGFNGTSIRDIAKKAKVNPATISYYFDNKHGLLEHCFTIFFEGYVKCIEDGFSLLDKGAASCLKRITENIMYYQVENMYLTRLILREISIDSQMVREIMSTYLMKERFYLSKVFEKGIKTREFKKLTADYSILQLKGFLSMPFLNTQYMTEVLHILPNEKYFAEKYAGEIFHWIDGVVCNPLYERIYLAVK
ncbi:TetR/AcrR family transcriptional regulator [Cytobacillus depressus]|uniref:TetR/AcrR family transcriptional regulator n=1 Tax=Cytobacillus depressus TaxID=1602942 RepID=A0A6L3VB90_9BACI|nr:forespore capture DNA-binding protein RefZ [Cytobacillus depressus]KAB2338850.1 TetR/AcrR family transcriptional regulator [Cytobacillus depressus]